MSCAGPLRARRRCGCLLNRDPNVDNPIGDTPTRPRPAAWPAAAAARAGPAGQPSVTCIGPSSGPWPPTGPGRRWPRRRRPCGWCRSRCPASSRCPARAGDERSGSSAGRTSGRVVRELAGEPAVERLALGLLERRSCRSRCWRRAARRAAGANCGSSARSCVGESSCGTSGMPSSSGKMSRAVWPSGCVIACASLCGGPPPDRVAAGREPVGDRRLVPPYPWSARPCAGVRRRTPGRGAAWPADGGGSGGCMAIADEVQRIGAPVRRWARTQKREYTNGEARPLAGDLGAMGVYVGLVSAAAAAVRASGRELPERIPRRGRLPADRGHLPAGPPDRQGPGDRPDPGAVRPVRGRVRARRGRRGGAGARRREARRRRAAHLPVLPGPVGGDRVRVRLRQRARRPPGWRR